MRTSIELDGDLLSSAMAATGFASKKATIEEGLRLLLRIRGQIEAFDDLKALGWHENLNAMRRNRPVDRRRK